MGLDAQWLIKPFIEIPTDEFECIRLEFYGKFPDPEEHSDYRREDPYRYPEMTWGEYSEDRGLIVVRELHRYYGQGYERGCWPYIRRVGDWLAIRFGELAELRYGDDCSYWDYYAQWGKIRGVLDKHWDEVGNVPYHGRQLDWTTFLQNQLALNE